MRSNVYLRVGTPGTPLTLCLASWLALAPALAAQDAGRPAAKQGPTFASTVDVVNLCVSVTDPRDSYVKDLAAGDFKVLEDGVPQEVVLFSHDRVPLSVAFLIDNSLSMAPSLPSVKAAATRLVRALAPADEAQVVHFNHRFALQQEFTPDKTALEAAIQGITAEGATGIYNALYVTLKDRRFRARPDDLRRRAIVVLSDGEDTSSVVTDDQVVELARQRDATIYTINLRAPRVPLPSREEALNRATHFLTALSRDTGGRAYFPPSLRELDGVYDRIADELRSQYAIGYVSSNPAHDGKWRRIAILTPRGNLLLRHRTGYYAARAARGLASLMRVPRDNAQQR